MQALQGDYRDLYLEWERGQWEASAAELGEDAVQWAELEDPLRAAIRWLLTLSLGPREAMTDALVPLADALPSEEQQLFLSTQIVDDARHTVLLDRFLREVVGRDDPDMRARLEGDVAPGPGLARLTDLVVSSAHAVAEARGDERLLRDAILVRHALVAGAVAAAAAARLGDLLRGRNVLSGFAGAWELVSRDLDRHVAFGDRFLHDQAAASGEIAGELRTRLDELGPAAVAAAAPTPPETFGEVVDAAALQDTIERRIEERRTAIGLAVGSG